MFLKAFETAISQRNIIKAGLSYSRYARFSQQSSNKKKDDYSFFYAFDKDATLKTLQKAQKETNPAYEIVRTDLLTFDKLSASENSETYRVFDLYHKKFFALKTLSLDSESAWKEVNLMLRYHSDSASNYLAPVHSFSYHEANQEVKILSGLQKTIIGKYAYHRKRQGLPWNKQELTTVLWHLLQIINAIHERGASTHYLKPDHIFFDPKEGKLRAFDHPGSEVADYGFHSKSWSFYIGDCSNPFDVAIHTLVQIIDPYAPIDNPAEARAYLKNNYPEFSEKLKTIEANSKGIGFLYDNLAPLDQIFESQENDRSLLDALKKTLDERYPENAQENWAFINQGLGNYDEASVILRNLLHQNTSQYGPAHPSVAKSYVDLAELYYDKKSYKLSSEYFQNALDACQSGNDLNLLARLYFRHGKLLEELGQDHEEAALQEFQKAYDTIKHSPDAPLRLKKDIERTLSKEDDERDDSSSEDLNTGKRKRPGFFKILISLWLLRFVYLKVEEKYHEQKSILEPAQKDLSVPVQPEPESKGSISVSYKLGPFEYEYQDTFPKSSTPSKPVEPAQINIKNVPVAVDGSEEGSKFPWFLVGLNVAIGCAGLALSSLN